MGSQNLPGGEYFLSRTDFQVFHNAKRDSMGLRLKGFQHLDFLPLVTEEIKKTCPGMHYNLDLHSDIEHFLDTFLSTSTSTEWNPSHIYPLLPLFCCEAAQGNPVQAIPVSAAWMAFYLAAHLLDALEDNEPPKYSNKHSGKAGILNLSTGLMMVAELILDALDDHGIDPITARVVRIRLHKTIFEMCSGQHSDLQTQSPGIHFSQKIAGAKSGSFFSAACYSGAILAMDDPDQLNWFSSFGYQLGMIVQIEDDISDFLDRDSRNNDLALGKWSLPVAYALEVLPAEATNQLKGLLVEAKVDRTAEKAARQIILDSGGIFFLDLELKKHYHLADIAMKHLRLSPTGRQNLQDILDELIA
jgi:hypothetical protein